MKQAYWTLLLTLLSLVSLGQVSEDCYALKDFLIINSTKDYESALLTAQKAAKAINAKINLRDLTETPNRDVGLTLPADTCVKLTSDSICYVARGRWDDGIYISIEYSNAYVSFTKGYYLVMVGSAAKSDKNLREVLASVQKKYSDAYIKTSKVYMCCMH